MLKSSIDLDYMKNISLGNKKFEFKLLRTFVQQTTVEMKKIMHSLEKEDWDSLHASAHMIKPSFHFIGRPDMAMLLNTIEGIAKDKSNLGQLPELVNRFLQSSKHILKDVIIEIEKYEE